MAGRKPTPFHLRVIDNNPQKRPMPKTKRIVDDKLKMPPGLTDGQKKHWRYVIEKSPAGLLKGIDRKVLHLWVIAADIHETAEENLRNSSMLIKTPNGMAIPSPYINILNRQAEIMHKLNSELGFTPAARARLDFIDASPSESEEGSDYFTD